MKRKILLVEDRPSDVKLTKRAIAKTGFDVDLYVTSHGKEALRFLLSEDKPLPDLILLDWMMPLMNGHEFLQERTKYPEIQNIPVIVLTTSCDDGDIQKAYENQCNAYLIKPIDPRKFQETIDALGHFWLKMTLLPKQG